jgi:DNA-directed RNA polymerase specialized sigma24 family protein
MKSSFMQVNFYIPIEPQLLVQSSPRGGSTPLDLRSLSPVELVATCLATKDGLVWTEFVRRFRPLISTIVLRTARNWGEPNPSLLDDLIQETYLKLCADDCRLLRNFRSQYPSAIFGFLKVVTANVVHDHFKATHAAKRGAGGVPASLQDSERGKRFIQNGPIASDSSAIERAVLLEEIDRCLANGVSASELPRSRRIFWLYYRCGLSARAIAALPEVQLTTKGVESTILRLNRMVKAAIRPPESSKSWPGNDSRVPEKGLRRAGSL